MLARELVVVAGLPSRLRVAGSSLGATGVMSLLCSLIFAVAGASESSKPGMVPALFVYMIAFWAPATCTSAWWISVPVVLIGGILGALLTHRYPLSVSRDEGNTRRRTNSCRWR